MAALRNTPRIYVAKTAICIGICHGNEREQNVVLTYRIHPGDEPAVEIQTVRLTSFCNPLGTDAPSWLLNQFECDEDLLQHLLTKAAERDLADRDDAAETAWRERRAEHLAA